MSDPVVHITNGIPDSGTGNITTLGAVVSALGTPFQAGGSVGITGTVSVTGSFYQATQPVSGTFWQATQPVSIATVKAASTAPVASDTALVVAISPNSVNVNGQAVMANSAPVAIASNQSAIPVAIAPSTIAVAVVPTVTASAYTAGNGIGGIMTFASILAATSFSGILQSITAKYKGTIVNGSLDVAIFKASPSGTYTDKTAPTWNTADMANLLGIYRMGMPNSKFGTMTVYNLDNIGKAIVGASQSLFAVVIVDGDGVPTPASTSDFTLELSVVRG